MRAGTPGAYFAFFASFQFCNRGKHVSPVEKVLEATCSPGSRRFASNNKSRPLKISFEGFRAKQRTCCVHVSVISFTCTHSLSSYPHTFQKNTSNNNHDDKYQRQQQSHYERECRLCFSESSSPQDETPPVVSASRE